MASGDEVVTTTPNPVATKQVAVAAAAAAEAAVVAAAEPAEPEPPSQVADMVKQGQRKAIEGQLNDAANIFGDALGMMVQEFGELSDKCVETYRLYGSALLALAKTEGPMGGEGGGEEGGEDGAGAAEEDLEELTTRQLAWEVLDTARVILSKKSDKASALQLAELHMELGECSLEGGSWEEAIQEFTACLEIRLKFTEPTSRILSESHYLLAVAYHNADRFGDASAEYKQAARILNVNIEMMTAAPEGDEKTKNAQDLQDLKAMLKEINRKITDLADEAKVAKMREAQEKEKAASGAVAAAGVTTIGFGNNSGGGGGGAAAPAAGVTTIGFGNSSSGGGGGGGGGGAAAAAAAGVTTIGFGNGGGGGVAAASGEVTTIGFGSTAKRTGQAAAVTLSSSLIKKRKTAN